MFSFYIFISTVWFEDVGNGMGRVNLTPTYIYSLGIFSLALLLFVQMISSSLS